MNLGIIDDHHMITEGYLNLFRDSYNCTLIAHNGIEMVSQFEKILVEAPDKLPDVVILDLTMPEMDGIECIKWIKEKLPSVKIVICSMQTRPELVMQAVEMGVNAYVTKNEPYSILNEAISSVIAEKTYLSSLVTSIIVAAIQTKSIDKSKEIVDSLTTREIEVLKFLCDDLTSAEIGKKLDISMRTVEVHKNNLMSKLNAKGRSSLVRLAIRYGIINA